jgi:hypothetical protein
VTVMIDERLRGDEGEHGRPQRFRGHASMLERGCFAVRFT